MATLTLEQARDRFAAGVADTIEVVQAQEAVSSADDNVISALFAHSSVKAIAWHERSVWPNRESKKFIVVK